VAADDVVRRIGEALTRLRQAQGLSLAALARKAGLTAERAEDIETGKYMGLTVAGLVAYADALGVELDLLADSIAEMFEQTAAILEEKRNG